MQNPETRTPWHRDPKTRGLVFQAVAVLFFVWALATIASNTIANLEERGIRIGLGFMSQVVPFGIGFTPFWDFKLGESLYWEVLVIGVQNTILVSFFGVIGATLLGFLLGVLRLSPNWLVAKLASAYVEFFRNVPLLLWVFFWYVAVFLPSLPPLRESLDFGAGIFLNNEGFYLPRPLVDNAAGFAVFCLFVAVAVAAIFPMAKWAKKRQDATGARFPVFWAALALLIAAPVAGFYISGQPFHLEYPQLGRFVFEGGINLSLSFFVMWFALTTYTAAFIGENVRGGILAVSRGQTEAARALGLHHGVTLRLVVIPQAMRVIIPPTISQFLNLTKNSTLAVAVAYEEIASIWMGIALNQTGQALIIIAITIFVFWTLSFLTSAFLNAYNRRVQLTER